MTNEELILQRLDALDAKIDPIIKERQKWVELKEDLMVLGEVIYLDLEIKVDLVYLLLKHSLFLLQMLLQVWVAGA